MSYKSFNCLKFVKSCPGDQQIHINELHYTNKRPLASSQGGQTKRTILTWLQIIPKEGERQSQSGMFARREKDQILISPSGGNCRHC